MIFYQNILFLAIHIFDVPPTCINCTKVSDNLNPHVHAFDTVSLFASMHLQLLSHKLLITETFNRFCFAV